MFLNFIARLFFDQSILQNVLDETFWVIVEHNAHEEIDPTWLTGERGRSPKPYALSNDDA